MKNKRLLMHFKAFFMSPIKVNASDGSLFSFARSYCILSHHHIIYSGKHSCIHSLLYQERLLPEGSHSVAAAEAHETIRDFARNTQIVVHIRCWLEFLLSLFIVRAILIMK
jgi:hypothetical protein